MDLVLVPLVLLLTLVVVFIERAVIKHPKVHTHSYTRVCYLHRLRTVDVLGSIHSVLCPSSQWFCLQDLLQ